MPSMTRMLSASGIMDIGNRFVITTVPEEWENVSVDLQPDKWGRKAQWTTPRTPLIITKKESYEVSIDIFYLRGTQPRGTLWAAPSHSQAALLGHLQGGVGFGRGGLLLLCGRGPARLLRRFHNWFFYVLPLSNLPKERETCRYTIYWASVCYYASLGITARSRSSIARKECHLRILTAVRPYRFAPEHRDWLFHYIWWVN